MVRKSQRFYNFSAAIFRIHAKKYSADQLVGIIQNQANHVVSRLAALRLLLKHLPETHPAYGQPYLARRRAIREIFHV